MKLKLRASLIATIALTLLGCGAVDDATDRAKEVDAPDTSSAEQLEEDVRTAVVDKLDCSGMVREETRQLVGDALDRDHVELDQLVTSPKELARMVAAAAATTDSTILLWGNVGEVLRHGYFPSALDGGWNEFGCDDRQSFQCQDALGGGVVGQGQTSVVCDQSAPTAVRAEFSGGCKLFGTENAGALEMSRQSVVSFDQFELGSVRQVDGKIDVDVQSGELHRLEVDTGGALTVASNSGKSCEQRLTVRTLVAAKTLEQTRIDIDAERLADEKTVAVSTVGGPVHWQASSHCSCPTAGSVELRVSNPVGLGKEGTLRLHYQPGQGERCSTVQAEVLSWPNGCEKIANCGRDTIESLMGDLVGAACVDLE